MGVMKAEYLLLFVTIVSALNPLRNNPNGVDTYSDQEFKMLSKFQTRVQDVLTLPHMFDNRYLIRFLRAGNWNLDTAEAKIRQNFRWRQQNNVDNLVTQNFTHWQRRIPHYFNFDRQGRPGVVTSLMNLDARGLVLTGKTRDFIKYFVHFIENLSQSLPGVSNATGKEFVGFNVLYNLGGFSRLQHMCGRCISFWIELMEIYEKSYPHGVHAIRIINAPRLYASLDNILKPLLGETMSKVTTYGVDKGEWRPKILKIYSQEQLTREFGGVLEKQPWDAEILPQNSLFSPNSARNQTFSE